MTELSEEQKKFLAECEAEFAGRFTEADKEFMEHCNRPTNPPPILDDWMNFRGGFQQRDHRRFDNQNNQHGRYRNQRDNYGHSNKRTWDDRRRYWENVEILL